MVELAHILRQFGPAYQQTHQDSLLPSHRRAMVDIGNCRTAVFGGHLYTCQDCHATQYSYHSCQNRHCPKCQHQAGQDWLMRQQELLLPVPYFLLTFTLPAEIRPLARSHQKLIYTLLFRASAAATQKLPSHLYPPASTPKPAPPLPEQTVRCPRCNLGDDSSAAHLASQPLAACGLMCFLILFSRPIGR